MKDRLLHASDISEIYGLSMYEARSIMNKLNKINISNGTMRPRWVVKQADLDAYFERQANRKNIIGLDRFGRIIRRR